MFRCLRVLLMAQRSATGEGVTRCSGEKIHLAGLAALVRRFIWRDSLLCGAEERKRSTWRRRRGRKGGEEEKKDKRKQRRMRGREGGYEESEEEERKRRTIRGSRGGGEEAEEEERKQRRRRGCSGGGEEAEEVKRKQRRATKGQSLGISFSPCILPHPSSGRMDAGDRAAARQSESVNASQLQSSALLPL
ncbi:unnamed protein product [Closterium sp. Naga37s-1]|nr:unnamed protein product [Closterium sp. Naga37s-1]